MVRAVGLSKAKEMVMLGRRLDGAEAERIGMINKAVNENELESEVHKWVDEIMKLPPLPVGLGKRVVDKSLDMDTMSSLDFTGQVQRMLMNTGDFKEAVTAKLEKRTPVFKGK